MDQPKKWEYKSIRFDYLGRGITQQINLLDIDSKRLRGWGNRDATAPSLSKILADLGRDGWEMVSHTMNQDNQNNGVTFHYMQFKRELLDESFSVYLESFKDDDMDSLIMVIQEIVDIAHPIKFSGLEALRYLDIGDEVDEAGLRLMKKPVLIKNCRSQEDALEVKRKIENCGGGKMTIP